ncbi:MAG: Cna B-type domain-containing protein [Clostridiales bacterium]|nr:Cna B-type domain-containing protein [Clostridiales bacterium]
MKKMFLGIFAAALSLALCFGLCVSAFAEGSVIRFSYVQAGVVFRLYKIGDFEDGRGFAPSEEFGKYSVNFESTDSAATLRDYIERDNIKPGQTAVTDGGKTAYFEGVESGYYLIIGEDFSDGKYIYEAQPVLLAVYDNGEYYLDVTGKYEVITLSEEDNTTSVTAMKIWSGGSETAGITAQLLRDGEVYDEAELNSGNSWRYMWSGLASGYDWAVVEKSVPTGYTVSVEKDGAVFIINNTKDSTDEKESETKTKTHSEGGGGGGSTILNPPKEAAEAETEITTETEGETVTEASPEETTKNYSGNEEDKDIPEAEGENGEGSGSEGSRDKASEGSSIGESTLSSNLTAGQSSAADSSSAVINSSAESRTASAGSAGTAEAGEASAARLPQTGQLWLPVPFLCCGGILCLILGIGRKRLG